MYNLHVFRFSHNFSNTLTVSWCLSNMRHWIALCVTSVVPPPVFRQQRCDLSIGIAWHENAVLFFPFCTNMDVVVNWGYISSNLTWKMYKLWGFVAFPHFCYVGDVILSRSSTLASDFWTAHLLDGIQVGDKIDWLCSGILTPRAPGLFHPNPNPNDNHNDKTYSITSIWQRGSVCNSNGASKFINSTKLYCHHTLHPYTSITHLFPQVAVSLTRLEKIQLAQSKPCVYFAI